MTVRFWVYGLGPRVPDMKLDIEGLLKEVSHPQMSDKGSCRVGKMLNPFKGARNPLQVLFMEPPKGEPLKEVL